VDTTASVVAEVNVALGTDYRLVRQLPGGLQSSAYELTAGGTRVVLKWSDDPGWAPRVGTTAAGSPYQLQAFVAGAALRDASTIGPSLAGELIAICETQRELVPDGDTNWSVWAGGVVFDGWDGVWDRVRGYGGEATEVLERYGVLCAPYRGHELPGDDLVHGDLNVGNVIVDNGRVAGIVDIEAASGGSRAYDLVSLATSATRDGAPAGVDELFLEAALRAGGRAAVAVCAAAAYASIAEFVRERSKYSQELVLQGARRLLELLDA
jgi:aminoglycoside phosphotransferase (APT) family kinase protein